MNEERLTVQVQREISGLVRTALLLVWREVVRDTPVDFGRARAGWNVSVGVPDLSVPPETKTKVRTPRLSGLGNAMKGVDFTKTPGFVSNNVEYMFVLAKGRHFDAGQNRGSKQQPSAGWIDRAAERGLNQAEKAFAGRFGES